MKRKHPIPAYKRRRLDRERNRVRHEVMRALAGSLSMLDIAYLTRVGAGSASGLHINPDPSPGKVH